MNLSGAQGISYAIRGDATQLRQALREAAADVRAFGQTVQSSLVGPAQIAAAAQAQISTAAAATAAALRAQATAATQAGGTTAAAAFSTGAALGRQAAAVTTAAAATAGAANTTAAAQARVAAAANAAANSQAAASARAAAAAESAAAAQAAAAATVAAANARVAGSAAGAAGAMNTMGASGVASLSSMSGILSHLVGPLGFAALIAIIAKTGVGFNDFMARQEIAFTTMLGSASASKEFLSDMLAFAKTTPFSFPELTASAQKMVAFGIESEKVVDIMRTLGDATVGSGGSMAELQGLGIVLGQVSAKGRLMGQELLQFAERGIPALTVLANKSNMSVADFQEKVSKGQVRSEEAITNLIDGLRDGTTGINGTTAAYDGLMAKVKESSIFSSAFDSFKSGFRNMSAELTESLTPSLVAMVNVGGDAMGAIKGIAAAFNSLAGPTKSVSIAIAGVLVAGRLLGPVLQRSVGGALTSVTASLGSMAIGTRLAALRVGEFRLAMSGIGAASASASKALMGAFGGPWGLALIGATGLMMSFAQANAQAKADAEELRASLDETTGALTEQSEAIIRNQLFEERKTGGGIFGFGEEMSSRIEDAKTMGIALTTLYSAMEGDPEALALAREQITTYLSAFDRTDESDSGAYRRGDTLRKELAEREEELATAKEIAAIKQQIIADEAAADAKKPKTATELSDDYRDAAFALHNFAEEQEKVLQSQQQIGDAAGKAFDAAFSTINGFEATVVTAEQLADARAKVTDATNSLRQAEESQNRDAGRRKTTSADRKKSADDVAKAIRNQSDAQKELTELEAKDIPVADQMMEHYRKTLEDATKFAGDIEALASAGLDPKLINDLVLLGPEAAVPQLEQLLGASGAAMIDAANQTEDVLKGLNMRVVENGRLTAIAMQSSLSSTAADLPMAMKIAAEQNGRDSASAVSLAQTLGISSEEVQRIAASFGQDWVKGRDEYLEQNPMKVGQGGVAPTAAEQGMPGQIVADVEVAPNFSVKSTIEDLNTLAAGMTAQIEAKTLNPTIAVNPTYSITGAGGTLNIPKPGIPGAGFGGNFYTGGIYPGYTPGRDTGYIGVGGGEAIMRPEWTRAIGPDYVHTMNALARSGGVNAIRKAIAGPGYLGAFAGGGIAGGSQWSPPASAPQIIEVPVTQRVEHHGVTTIGTIVAADPMDFDRKVRQRRRGSFTGGR